jgi:hypothetical protein
VKLTPHAEWQRDISDRVCAFATADKEQSAKATTAIFRTVIDNRSPIVLSSSGATMILIRLGRRALAGALQKNFYRLRRIDLDQQRPLKLLYLFARK